MMYLEGAAVFFFYVMLLLRQKAENFIAAGKWQENEWGLGQIIAAFSWAPLLVDLGCAIFEFLML